MSMAAGWYPDPFSNGYLRWWDGERWTPQTVLAQAPPVAQQPPVVPQQPYQGQPYQGEPYQPPGAYPAAPPPPPAYPGYPGYGAPVTGPPVAPFPLATWGSRFGARLIDTILVLLVIAPLAVLLLWAPLRDFVHAFPADGRSPSVTVVADFERRIVGRSLILSLVSVIVQFAYEVPQLTAYGRTLGKRAMHLRVRPLAEDRLPNLKEASIRMAVSAGGSLIGGGLFTLLDDLFPLWDKPWQQALHDKAAKTIVVPHRP